MKNDRGSFLTITSLQNPRAKSAMSLREREHRDQTGLMLIDGLQELGCALHNHHIPVEIYWCPEACKDDAKQAVEECRRRGAKMYECSRKVLEKITYGNVSGGWVAVAPQVKHQLEKLPPAKPALIIVAEKVEKPGNLGSILRSADAAGANAVIVCDGATDVNNPNVVRNSRGAVFTVPVVESSNEATRAWLRQRGVRIVATTPHTEHTYTNVDFLRDTALVVGSEHEGLSSFWLEAADLQVRIPMLGQMDSLNVSHVVTVVLYEAVRQRGMDRKPTTENR
jgi:TrmH family RNA methyltransferase